MDKDKEPSSSSCLPSPVESINNYNSIAGNFAAQKGEKKRSDVEKSEIEHVYCLFTPKGMSAHDVATSHQRKKKKMECVARQKKVWRGTKKRLVGTLGAACHFPPPPSISLQVVTFTQTKTPSPVKGAEGKESQLSHADLNPFFSEGGKEAKLGSQSDGRKSLGARPSARRKNFVPLLLLPLPSCFVAHLTSRRRHLKSGNIFFTHLACRRLEEVEESEKKVCHDCESR